VALFERQEINIFLVAFFGKYKFHRLFDKHRVPVLAISPLTPSAIPVQNPCIQA
jgi:hypothetical protein